MNLVILSFHTVWTHLGPSRIKKPARGELKYIVSLLSGLKNEVGFRGLSPLVYGKIAVVETAIYPPRT